MAWFFDWIYLIMAMAGGKSAAASRMLRGATAIVFSRVVAVAIAMAAFTNSPINALTTDLIVEMTYPNPPSVSFSFSVCLTSTYSVSEGLYLRMMTIDKVFIIQFCEDI